MGVQVQSNADELAAALLRVGDELLDLEPVNTKAGSIVQAAASPPRRTGALSASLLSVAGPTETVVGSNLRYATFVHWGAPAHHVRAQPFLLTALEVTNTELADLYKQHLSDTLADNL